MKNWPGHLPITCMVLFSILKRATTEECEFSRDERVLVTACEFWAAVSASELRAHLGSQPTERLRAAGIALGSLGAVALVQTVFAGIDELMNLKTRECRDECVDRLEHRLQLTEDSVDVLIGLMAHRCLSVVPIERHTAVGAMLN
jgi:hypothetical protein